MKLRLFFVLLTVLLSSWGSQLLAGVMTSQLSFASSGKSPSNGTSYGTVVVTEILNGLKFDIELADANFVASAGIQSFGFQLDGYLGGITFDKGLPSSPKTKPTSPAPPTSISNPQKTVAAVRKAVRNRRRNTPGPNMTGFDYFVEFDPGQPVTQTVSFSIFGSQAGIFPSLANLNPAGDFLNVGSRRSPQLTSFGIQIVTPGARRSAQYESLGGLWMPPVFPAPPPTALTTLGTSSIPHMPEPSSLVLWLTVSACLCGYRSRSSRA